MHDPDRILSDEEEKAAYEAIVRYLDTLPEDPIERARAAGIDLDLIDAQLRLSPIERIRVLEERRLEFDRLRVQGGL